MTMLLRFSRTNWLLPKVPSFMSHELFHGDRGIPSHAHLLKLPKRKALAPVDVKYTKYPAPLMKMNPRKILASGTMANNPHYTRIFNITLPRQKVCILSSTQREQTEKKCFRDFVQQHTNGFSVQLLLQGQERYAYFDPEWPHLTICSFGRPVDYTNVLVRAARDVQVTVLPDRKTITVHGAKKRAVLRVASALQSRGAVSREHLKGIRFAGYPVKKQQLSGNKKY